MKGGRRWEVVVVVTRSLTAERMVCRDAVSLCLMYPTSTNNNTICPTRRIFTPSLWQRTLERCYFLLHWSVWVFGVMVLAMWWLDKY